MLKWEIIFKLIKFFKKDDNKSKSNICENGRPTPLKKIKGHMEYVITHLNLLQ